MPRSPPDQAHREPATTSNEEPAKKRAFSFGAAEMKQMIVPMEIKAVGDAGVFSGYASIFGNVDLGGDVISKDDPFKEIVTNPDGKVLTLFSHDAGGIFTASAAGGLPIGTADVSQNSKGLKFDGQLVMEDPFVQRVHTHMKAKTLTGMSIGYDVLPGGSKVLESGIRELNALKLWEISVVIWGMNPKASIDTVKSVPQFSTIRECEFWLRDELGLSNSAAKEFVARFRKSIFGARDEPTRDESDQMAGSDYLKFLNSISEK
jgi:HK97 family phage prohead protease